MKTRYILKNKRRFFSIIASLIAVFSFLSYNYSYAYKDVSYKTVRVNRGDTLWSIAGKNNSSGDIREYIHHIKKLNKLASSEIIEGCELVIPDGK